MTKSNSQFLAHGEVSVKYHDVPSRMVALQICIPSWLMTAATPILLGAGLIDEYEIRSPLSVWFPTIPNDRFIPEYVDISRDLSLRASEQSVALIKAILEWFIQLSKVLKDPTDAVPILPLGIYVTFQYRCRIDAMAEALLKLESLPLAGIPEFRFALAEVLAYLLDSEGVVKQLES